MAIKDKISAKTVSERLVWYLRTNAAGIVLQNVFVHGSPWESDVIRVTQAWFWTEFEIKVSRPDFFADMRKRLCSWNPNSPTKHDLYASAEPIRRSGMHAKILPKPKKFFFVTPAGLIAATDVPSHCGLIELDPEGRHHGLSVVKQATVLPCHTKLSANAIFNLAAKAARKVPA